MIRFELTPPAPDPSVRSWIFTFGCGQLHPSGHRLDDCFVEIPHADYAEARAEMVRRFGTVWCGQYPSREAARVLRPGCRELTGAESLGGGKG